MKKYFIAVAALGFLAACTGKQAQNVPVEVEEEEVTVAEVVPAQPAMPILPAMKKKPAKAVNMRDSLKVDAKKGAVIQKKYKAKAPVAVSKPSSSSASPATSTDVVYDLTLYYQDNTPEGVFEMDATYVDETGQNQTYSATGKQQKKQGTPSDASAVVYELVPSDGENILYFLVQGNTLILLDENMQPSGTTITFEEVN